MRLRTKYAIAFVVVAFVLVGLVFVSTENFKSQMVDREREDLNRTAALTAEQVAGSFNERVRRFRSFASDPRLAELDSSGQLLRSYVNNTGFLGAQVLDRNGTIVAFAGPVNASQRAEIVGSSDADELYFERALTQQGLFISRPERVGGGLASITFSAPVFGTGPNGTQRVTGVVAAFARIDVGPHDTRVDDLGLFAPFSPLETDRQTVVVTGTARNGETLVLDGASQSFERSLVRNATIQGPEWTLSVRRDRSGLDERLATLQAVQGGGIVLVLLTLVALGFWEYRTTLRQADRLLTGFDALKAGEFDHRLSLSAAEEWRQISDGFNDLAAELHDREQQLSVLNRVLRHNLKNDLSVIGAYAENLQNLSDDELAEAAERVQAKVHDLLSYSGKAGRLENVVTGAGDEPATVDLVTAVEDAIEDYAEEYPDVTVTADLPDTCQVRAVTSLAYAVESLVENAFEYADDEDPAVEVGIDRVDGDVELTIVDNGPGIPEHEVDVLRQDAESALKHGSGVGLWLAYWVIKTAGGAIRFKRRSPSGTLVTVRLQAADTATGADATEGVGAADD